MEEKELIQLNIQLPMAALGRLSSLLERMERLFSSTEESREQGENRNFDPEQFQTLSAAGQAAPPAPAEPHAVSPRFSVVDEAPSAETEVIGDLSLPGRTPPRWDALPEEGAEPPPLTLADIVPAAAQAEVSAPLPRAVGAGFSVEREMPQPRGGRFAMVEELTGTGSAPLTAQAVSAAFQRDERRYDNGFPLY